MPIELRPGDRFADRYEIHRRLGSGGFGQVYKAFDTASKKEVALKSLSAGRWSSPFERWREYAMLRLLSIDGVARMVDQGVSRNTWYLATEYVDGSYFPSRLNRASWQRLEPLARSLLETLAQVHARGVVHADLKPSNVLVTEGDQVVLVDFGVAHRAFEGDENRETAGSPTYMSLELFAGDPPTPRSDLFAVGVMLYEALTGEAMFDTRSIMEWFGRLREHGPPSIRGRVEGLPEEAVLLVDALRGLGETRLESASQALATIDPSVEHVDWREDLSRAEPWTPDELQQLFHGPEIGWRLQSRAAFELYSRTAGDPEDVLKVLQAWVAAGFAHFELGRFRVGLRGLALIETGRIMRPAVEVDLEDEEKELLGFIKFVQPLTLEELRELFGSETDRVFESVQEYVVVVDSQIRMRKNVLVERGERHVEAARAFLKKDSEPSKIRADLALVCEDAQALVDEVIALADELDQNGYTRRSLPILRSAVQFLEFLEAEPERRVLLKRWARAGIWSVSEENREEVVFAHRDLQPPYLRLLELISRARTEGVEVFEELGSIGPFDEPDFELARHIYRSICTRQLGVEYQEEAWQGAVEYAERVQTQRAWGVAKLLEGYVAYDEFDFERAADLFTEAAELAIRRTSRISRLYTAGLMVEYALNQERALELMTRVRELARAKGEADLFLRAYASCRQQRNALGHRLTPETEHIEAALLGLSPWKSANAYLTEAAIAWRSGDEVLARELVLGAAGQWEKTDFVAGRVLCRSFALFLSDERPSRAEVDDLFALRDEIRAPRLRAQAMILLSRCIDGPERQEWVEDALSRVPLEQHSKRLELIRLDAYDSLTPRFERYS